MSLKNFSQSEKVFIRTLQVIGFISGVIYLWFAEGYWPLAITAGIVYCTGFYWLGRLILKLKGGASLFSESQVVAKIKQYLALAFVASFIAFGYLWFKAWNLDFSDNLATCLTRGSQGCLETFNPVWTAGTLKWLAPLMMCLSLAGLFIFALMKNYWPTLLAAFLYIVGMAYLVLNYEIKNKSQWLSQSINNLTEMGLNSPF